MTDFPLSKQPTPAFEPDPLPGEKPSTTVGVHAQSVYERARALGDHYAAQDELAMRKLKEVTPRLQARPAPELPATSVLPGFKVGRQEFSTTQALNLPKPELPAPEATKNPARGIRREDMTQEEKDAADEIKIRASNLYKYGVHPYTAHPLPPVTEVAKDVVKPPVGISGLEWNKHFNLKPKSANVDIDAQNATGLDIPKPQKVRKPGLSASVRRAAEAVATSHYEKSAAGINSDMDIKEAHGSALAYFKKNFTANGTNEEVDAHIRNNYSHMLIHEQEKRAPEFAPKTPAPQAKSRQQVKTYLQNPLSAYRGK